MRLSNWVFIAGVFVIGWGTLIYGGLSGFTVGSALGQMTGTLVGYGLIWFVYTRVEFQINGYMQRHSGSAVQDKSKRDGSNFEEGGMR
jgi:hypothetical protein